MRICIFQYYENRILKEGNKYLLAQFEFEVEEMIAKESCYHERCTRPMKEFLRNFHKCNQAYV